MKLNCDGQEDYRIEIKDSGPWYSIYEVHINYSKVKIIDDIIKWLSENCSNGFLVTELRDSIIAGGCVDNKKFYRRKQFGTKITKKSAHYDLIKPRYSIRISNEEDDTHFKLRWINFNE